MPPPTRSQRYRLHYMLRKRGNRIMARKRVIVKRALNLEPIEIKWISQLKTCGYSVSNPLFE